MALEVAQLLAALEAMPSRSAAILSVRCVKGVSRQGCADLYGISPAAFDALLLRAANDFARALAVAPMAESPEAAAQLASALDAEAGTPGFPALAALRAHKEAIAAALVPPAAADVAASPREKWLRRVAVIIVLLLTAYFYWQEKHSQPKFGPRPGQPTRVQR